MPDIAINRALMDTLSEAEKEEWVDSSPTRVFRYNTITKQARWLLLLLMSRFSGRCQVGLVLRPLVCEDVALGMRHSVFVPCVGCWT